MKKKISRRNSGISGTFETDECVIGNLFPYNCYNEQMKPNGKKYAKQALHEFQKANHLATFVFCMIGATNAIFQTVCAERLLSITPCAYPLLSDTIHCGIDDANLRQTVRVCDPDKAISMSEIEVIKNKLDTIYKRKNKYCVCRPDQPKPCWFRFGFAFLRRMLPVESGVSHLYSREFCPANESLLSFKKTYALSHSTRETIINYGKNFARLLRERWLMGECDEDILFLILLKRPNQLVRKNAFSYLPTGTTSQTPYIFASYGSLVQEKIDTFNSLINEFPINKKHLDPLQKIVEAENVNLENGYSLKVVTENLLEQFEATLSQTDEKYPSPNSRSHIPDWAMVVFVMCALLCLLMTIGLCLMRTSVRRGSPRSKPMDTTRRWKAGFVGVNETKGKINMVISAIYTYPSFWLSKYIAVSSPIIVRLSRPVTIR